LNAFTTRTGTASDLFGRRAAVADGQAHVSVVNGLVMSITTCRSAAAAFARCRVGIADRQHDRGTGRGPSVATATAPGLAAATARAPASSRAVTLT
jgi:hypothetical protein